MNFQLCLNLSSRCDFHDHNVYLTGQIRKVPRQKNNWSYEVDWTKDNGKNFPVPIETMRTIIPRTDHTTKLIEEGMDQFDQSNSSTVVAHLSNNSAQNVKDTPEVLRNIPPTPAPIFTAEEAAASI